MIRLITGTVASISNNGVVVLTHGIGYLVHTTKKTPLLTDDEVILHTHQAVRETALDLYGFTDINELSLFELLLTIPKIGPKSALQILDQADMALIIEAVTINDAVHLTKLSGISKKTAEKIVSELAGKIENLAFITNVKTPESTTDSYNDAFDTLLTLGYNPQNVRQILETLDPKETTSILVRQALQKLS